MTRKITRGVSRILAKKENHIYLGNLNAKRDWGFSPEYVECMWRMLQTDLADDYVVGTGESHSVQEFLDKVFSYADLDIEKHVKIDPKYFRPTEVEALIADTRKAKASFGWDPKIKLDDLVKIMVDADMRANGLEPMGEGDSILEKKFPNRWWRAD